MGTSFDFQSNYFLPDFSSEYGNIDVFANPLVANNPVITTMPIYQVPVIQSIKPVATTPVVATPVVPKKTIAFTVYDGNETLPGANIAIDGVATAQTNSNGYVIIPNVPVTATVQITYIGYEDYIISASAIPAKVILKSGTEQLQEVVIVGKKKPTSSNWAWWLVGAIAAVGIIKHAKSGTKIVRAKL